jgi:hypothetical protein
MLESAGTVRWAPAYTITRKSEKTSKRKTQTGSEPSHPPADYWPEKVLAVSSGPPPIVSPYVFEEAGTHRYNVGTDTPKLCATSRGGVPPANSFLAA